MASRRSRPRRLLLPTILAAILAAEITGLAIARTLAPGSAPAPAPAVVSGGASTAIAGGASDASSADAVDRARDAITTDAGPGSVATDLATSVAGRPAERVRSAVATTRPKTTSTSGPAHSTSYHGQNHVWIPSLGINKAVQSFPCSRTRPPDAGVYRWGCSGRNNVYLMGHAWSTFKPLHDAYVGGRLKKGMKVYYADGASRVHTYSVIWWKVTAPTTAASWAWASLSRPSMTLQTCVGANSAYRLMVRLVQVG
jgi:sortase (surface protein transpeptidase)